jgi:hypothetical protein
MTPAKARELAQDLYQAHAEAAAVLIVQATDPEPSEARQRAVRALLALDPWEPFVPEPAHALATAIGCLVIGLLYRSERSERARIAGLLDAVVREAGRISACLGEAA